jgi:hypothetical protein
MAKMKRTKKARTPNSNSDTESDFGFEVFSAEELPMPVGNHSKSPKILHPDEYKKVEGLEDGFALKFKTTPANTKLMVSIKNTLQKNHPERSYSIRMIDNQFSGIWRDDSGGKKKRKYGNRYTVKKDK